MSAVAAAGHAAATPFDRPTTKPDKAAKAAKTRGKPLTVKDHMAKLDVSIARHKEAIRKLEAKQASLRTNAINKARELASEAGVGFKLDDPLATASPIEA